MHAATSSRRAIIVLLVLVVVFSTRMSLGVLWVAVIAKLVVIAVVLVVGVLHVKAANFTPFIPASRPAEPRSRRQRASVVGRGDAQRLRARRRLHRLVRDLLRLSRVRHRRDRRGGDEISQTRRSSPASSRPWCWPHFSTSAWPRFWWACARMTSSAVRRRSQRRSERSVRTCRLA